MNTIGLSVHLDGGQQRDFAANRATRVAHVVGNQPPPATYRELFCRHYEVIRATHASATMPGVTVIAINSQTGQLMGRLWIAARVARAGSAIVGRHGKADLFLDGDDSLALRHLLIIIEPREPGSDDVCFRVIDLRTATAFEDERGRRHEALVSDGPMFVRCGDFFLYFLNTGGELELPESADDGWECIPPRVYLSEVASEPDRWLLRRRRHMRQVAVEHAAMVVAGPEQAERFGASRGSDRVTRVSEVRGLARPQMRLMEGGESPAGTLRIRTAAGEQRLLVGISALHRGILIGRYDRCDVEESSLLYSEIISRVHLVLMLISGRVHAIDTASTNATCLRVDGREIDIEPIDCSVGCSVELVLGGNFASVFWSPDCEAGAS